MIYLHIVIIGFVLAGPVFAGEKQFIEWWKNYDEQILVSGFEQNYRKKIELRFDSLNAYKGRIYPPRTVGNEVETGLVLYSQRNYTILLVTPKNIMKNMAALNEDYKQTMMKCADDKSWIVTLPENEWSEINLNPYCTMDYGEDAIRVDLYWTRSSTRPLIDIVTNTLTCIPHDLYGWDRKTSHYMLKSSKCTGMKTIESYVGSGLNLRQLY